MKQGKNAQISLFHKVQSLCSSYEPRNIFNLDKICIYFGILPNKTLCLKGEKCSSGNMSKEQLTGMLCVHVCGEFEQSLIIGKAEKPRCFRNFDVKRLNLVWESNQKA